MSPKLRTFLIWFIGWLAIDQVTKLWIYFNLAEGPRGGRIVVIPGWFDLVHAENPGAAFSMFASFEYRHIFFLGISCIAGWVVWDQLRRLGPKDVWPALGLGLIASGAAGNAIDRVWKRTVTDFLRVYVDEPSAKAWLIEQFGTYEWPSFNVADSALLVGVILYMIVGGEAAAAAASSKPEAEAAPPDSAT